MQTIRKHLPDPTTKKAMSQDAQLASVLDSMATQIKEPDSTRQFPTLVGNWPATTFRHMKERQTSDRLNRTSKHKNNET